ncbi:right-handed parallel beta-helix repeat-containing protein, partial [Bartonella bovis]|uniref:right-handed parallel beta-helix repeat-containing protein n=1 Tax=Bartonella bovis TaxID=155194 RepID=UPI0019591AF2
IEGGGGSGTGLSVQNGTGTLTSVDISKFGKGVEATGGKLEMMGGTVTFENGRGNFGVQVQNGGSAIITGATIKGKGTGTGVIMGSSKTLTMMGVTISGVKTGVEVKKGKVDMMGGTVTFTG